MLKKPKCYCFALSGRYWILVLLVLSSWIPSEKKAFKILCQESNKFQTTLCPFYGRADLSKHETWFERETRGQWQGILMMLVLRSWKWRELIICWNGDRPITKCWTTGFNQSISAEKSGYKLFNLRSGYIQWLDYRVSVMIIDINNIIC